MYQLFSRVKGGQQILLQHWSDYIKVRGAVSAGDDRALWGVRCLAEELGSLETPWFSCGRCLGGQLSCISFQIAGANLFFKDNTNSASTAYNQV